MRVAEVLKSGFVTFDGAQAEKMETPRHAIAALKETRVVPKANSNSPDYETGKAVQLTGENRELLSSPVHSITSGQPVPVAGI